MGKNNKRLKIAALKLLIVDKTFSLEALKSEEAFEDFVNEKEMPIGLVIGGSLRLAITDIAFMLLSHGLPMEDLNESIKSVLCMVVDTMKFKEEENGQKE